MVTSCFQLSQVACTSVTKPSAVGRSPPAVARLGTASCTPAARYTATISPATTMLGQRSSAATTATTAPSTSAPASITTNAGDWYTGQNDQPASPTATSAKPMST